MSKNCIRYSEEFKQQIIVDVYNSGSSVSYLSSEYGVTNVTIYSWIKAAISSQSIRKRRNQL